MWATVKPYSFLKGFPSRAIVVVSYQAILQPWGGGGGGGGGFGTQVNMLACGMWKVPIWKLKYKTTTTPLEELY